MSEVFDFIIIGSGVSGGKFAESLTQGGAKCVLLEAGRHFTRQSFPPSEMEYSTQLFWGGGLEVSQDGHLGFLRAKCVGGTSIVNQALLDPFDEDVWDDWKVRSGSGHLTGKLMEGYYERASKLISLKKVPEEHQNRNAKIFRSAFDRQGYQWKQLNRAHGDCATDKGSDCIVCLGGCPRDSKQSSLITGIKNALENGLKLESEFMVGRIEHLENEVIVFGTQYGETRTLRGRKVIMAAGAFGNSILLFQSGFQKKLPHLGKGFSCHPQYMIYGKFKDPVDAHKGMFQAVSSDDPTMRRAGYKFENVYAPPIGTAMLMPGFGKSHQNLMKDFRYFASMEVCIRDEPTGRILIDRKGNPIFKKSLTHQDKKRRNEGLDLIRELFESEGAKKIVGGTQGFGLHLMGGCAYGVDGKNSVVNPDFEIHDHPNLIVADSSVFPAAPGINPSFSIMAMSILAADKALSN